MPAEIIKSEFIISKHGFSTRNGGVSTGVYSSLNLGLNRGDDEEKVKKNWELFLEACGIDGQAFVCGNQVHGKYVHIATKEDLRPAYGKGNVVEADGFVTNEPGVPLAIFTADCVPVLLEDTKNKVIGAVHCGWRSAVADIEGEGLNKMLSLGAEKDEIRIAIGPAIEKCCFEVGPEVVEALRDLLKEDAEPFVVPRGDKYMVDLKGAVRQRFIQLGVKPGNIDIVDGCTLCEPERFWSHRYTGGVRGSQASVIMIS